MIHVPFLLEKKLAFDAGQKFEAHNLYHGENDGQLFDIKRAK